MFSSIESQFSVSRVVARSDSETEASSGPSPETEASSDPSPERRERGRGWRAQPSPCEGSWPPPAFARTSELLSTLF